MREVDYFIIGAGIAGMTAYRYLDSDDVVIAEPRPGKYKVGESIIPQHFFPMALRPLLEATKTLPSAALKHGTMFSTAEGLSYFHAYYEANFAIHADRRELEALYRKAFEVPILEARVDDIDFDHKLVTTSQGAFKVRQQILDCSGPAMVVARRLGLAHEVWPVWASWAYWDVEPDDEGFWDHVDAGRRPFFRFDDVERRLVVAPVDRGLRPSEMTMLTHVADGVWSWQIPLYQSRLLSMGFVSRHGPIDRAAYDELALRALGPQFRATARRRDGDDPHDRFHVRNRFAWAAERYASPDWALIGDAAFFGDPVYSVGTGIATNQAIRATRLINRHDWGAGAWRVYQRQTADLVDGARRAYEHWYQGDVTTDPEVAEDIQANFLNGLSFHVRTSEAYQSMWGAAAGETVAQPEYGDPGHELTELVPDPLTRLGLWTLRRAVARAGALELEWDHDQARALVMVVQKRAETERFFRAAGPFAFSYRSGVDGGGLDESGEGLFDAFARAADGHQLELLRLIEDRRPS